MTARIDTLSVSYRDGDHALLALDQVSLELRPGRITALVGESGSGKTTLGKALMGLLPGNAEMKGAIEVDGVKIVGMDEPGLNRIRWSRISMVFQNGQASLNPVHRVLDQVAEPLVQHGRMRGAEARQKAGEALREMGLGAAFGGRFPHQLSGGEAQRVLLAMALILDPGVIVLDEPTAALDAMSGSFVANVIRTLRSREKAVLLITHDLDLAGRLADDLVVLYLGQVMESMPARDLFTNPCHPYTLALCRSFPSLEATRDLSGIRGDGFYRVMHAHARNGTPPGEHSHISAPGSSHETGHLIHAGCLFEPRCTQALGECRDRPVPLFPVGGHRVRCIRKGIATLLQMEGVGKRYGSTVALAPTSLELRAGEFFCLVGETGSGKSTLAMIAAGVLKQDQGSRSLEGRDMDRWIREGYRSLARRIGVVYQNPADAVSHRLCVSDIVAEPLRIQGEVKDGSRILQRVKRVLADVHLSTEPEFLRRYPHELNMGAVQRICMARALVLEPAFLVADEPTSSLDPSVQAKLLRMLLEVQVEKGLTMLFVTHDIGLARKVGDRIGVMLAGRLVEVGPAARVLGCAAHPYTRRLIECAQGRGEASAAEPDPPVTAGCPYASRCDRSEKRCLDEPPQPVRLEGGRHLAWCHNPHVGDDCR